MSVRQDIAVIGSGIQQDHPSLPNVTGDAPRGLAHDTAVGGIIAQTAPDTHLESLRIFGAGGRTVADAVSYLPQYDIANMAWDYGYGFYGVGQEQDALETALDAGRDGIGTVIVKSAGNSRGERFATDDGVSSFKGSIVVAATDAQGQPEPYSTPGSNVLVSAHWQGTTTDITGPGGYTPDDTYDEFDGTSAATPIVTGAVALMLKANPALAWDEVQDILALTASGHEHNNDTGYGVVNIPVAVTLAETWDFGREHMLYQEATATGGDTIHTDADMVLGAVTLDLISGVPFSDIDRITVTSPEGMQSVVWENFGGPADTTTRQWDFMSQAFRGETAQGNWTVDIDGPAADYITSLEFTGRADAGAQVLRPDETPDNSQTLNASILDADQSLDLRDNTNTRNVVTSAGDDRIWANAQDNIIWGREGNDTVNGDLGYDIYRVDYASTDETDYARDQWGGVVMSHGDETDTLYSVEAIYFSDGETVLIGSLPIDA